MTFIHKKSRKEDPGNNRPVNLASVLKNIMKQYILNAITHHVKDNQRIKPSHHGFMKDLLDQSGFILQQGDPLSE